MSNIKIIGDDGKEVIPEEPREMKEPGDVVIPEGILMVEQLGKMFNFVPTEITEHKHKLQILLEYAKSKTDDHSIENLKWEVRHLGVKLGTPPLGEQLINQLFRYATLDLQSRKIDKEKERYINAN